MLFGWFLCTLTYVFRTQHLSDRLLGPLLAGRECTEAVVFIPLCGYGVNLSLRI